MIDHRLKTPLKVDAGAIWNRKPEKESTAKTIERELIFDFDMNDYDDVRTCCEGKKVCLKCWKLLVVAVEIIEQVLTEDFDFHQLMFVFSGGRGLHIWVCDQRACQLRDPVRKAIVDYLELVTGNEKAASLLSDHVLMKVEDNNVWKFKHGEDSRTEVKQYYMQHYLTAHVERSLKVLSSSFLEVMTDQEVFALDDRREFKHQKCIDLMLKIMNHRSPKLKEKVEGRWYRSRGSPPKEMFGEMEEEIVRFEMSLTVEDYGAGRQPDSKMHRISFIEEEIMLSFLYPRMDYNVSTMQNHLLKLPFSVHPSSKRISIPLFKRQMRDFDPEKCVKIEDLLKDLDYELLSSTHWLTKTPATRPTPSSHGSASPSRPWRSSLAPSNDDVSVVVSILLTLSEVPLIQ